MDEEKIKQAFQKIKQNIFYLQEQIYELKQSIDSLKNPTNTPTIPYIPTDKQTDNSTTPTENPTHQQSLEPLKTPNLRVSTGNRGVPTDKQTNRQTNRQTNQQTDNWLKSTHNPLDYNKIDDFQRAHKVLESLDGIKKEIRLKFKRLTPQEMLVFSTLYSLEEQGIDDITYKLIANNLNLSESSIRDYTNKLINKGIPIIKIRQNNKKITLKVDSNLKNIASLSTILKLKDI